MAHRIEVAIKDEFLDATGQKLRDSIAENLTIPVESVRTVGVYTIDADLSSEQLDRLARELFADPIVMSASTSPITKDFSWVIEVGYRPGVTDRTGRIASEAIRDMTGADYNVYVSRQYVLKGNLTRTDVDRIASDLLANGLIERWEIKNSDEWDPKKGFGIYMPIVKLQHKPEVKLVDLNVSDEELERIGKFGIIEGYNKDGSEIRSGPLALNLSEMKVIRNYNPRPTDAELEIIAAAWSDHCVHKRMNALVTYREGKKVEVINSLYKTFIRDPTDVIRKRLGKRDWLRSVFTDNAGVIYFGDGFNLAIKIETHNFPSFLDGFSGSGTGLGGVLRDPHETGMGHRIAASTDNFCFPDPRYSGPIPEGAKHPKRMYEDIRRGVQDYGNKFGTPTVNGSIRFDSYPMGSVVDQTGAILSYFRPLVYCGAVGIAPSYINGRPSHEKKARPGDAIILLGGKTGKDGIHGATASSVGIDKNAPATAVQIGDPYGEKKLFDMTLEARDLGYYKSITDNGAAGLTSSVGEMSRESGGGELWLEKVPLKYLGLQPKEIALSEAQERITISTPQKHVSSVIELARRRGVEATVIGVYTDTGRFKSTYSGQYVSDIDLEFLHNGFPRKKLEGVWTQPVHEEPDFEQPTLEWAVKKLLASPNIASKESVIRQYDHEVQASTVIKPLTGRNNDGPSDSSVMWPLEMQQRGSFRGFVISGGINANYGLIDTYHMAALNIDEAIRNAVASGADPSRVILLDNFCWSSPEHPYRVAQLVRACKAVRDYSLSYMTPFISGKDSQSNDYFGRLNMTDVHIAVPPTLLVTALGITHDIRKSITMDAKTPGNRIYVLGMTGDETGGSEYYAIVGSQQQKAFIGNKVPKVDAQRALKTYKKLYRAIQGGAVAACHDCSEGGLAVAAAEMAFAGGYGIEINTDTVPKTENLRTDNLLFSESASRLIVEVPEQYFAGFERTMKGVPYSHVGNVTNRDYLFLRGNGFDTRMHIKDLKDAWQATLR